MAGALAMAAVFGIGVVEMVFSPGRNCCAFPGDVVSSGGQGGKCGLLEKSFW
jgi:hypothetical protein